MIHEVMAAVLTRPKGQAGSFLVTGPELILLYGDR